MGAAFVSAVSFRVRRRSGASLTFSRRPAYVSSCPTFPPFRMIARPDLDGPPALKDYFNPETHEEGKTGAPIKLATGRSSLKEGNSYEAATIAIDTALRIIKDPHLVHITFGPLLDSTLVREAVIEKLNGKPILGRTVEKKGALDVIEVMIFRSKDLSSARIECVTESVVSDMDTALQKAATIASKQALEKLDAPQLCTFLIFAHSPGSPKAARRGFEETLPGLIAYGGPAILSNGNWALIGQNEHHKQQDDPADKQTVLCVAVTGSLSFLQSVFVKNWVQPQYADALDLMKPKYLNNAEVDLFTAIRYNDWEMFIRCLEDKNLSINVKWSDKLNQSPLLAACMRMRPRMVKYLVENGADVLHRNDAGYSAVMYTKMLSDNDKDIVRQQLLALRDGGANMQLTAQEMKRVERVVKGAIIEL